MADVLILQLAQLRSLPLFELSDDLCTGVLFVFIGTIRRVCSLPMITDESNADAGLHQGLYQVGIPSG